MGHVVIGELDIETKEDIPPDVKRAKSVVDRTNGVIIPRCNSELSWIVDDIIHCKTRRGLARLEREFEILLGFQLDKLDLPESIAKNYMANMIFLMSKKEEYPTARLTVDCSYRIASAIGKRYGIKLG